MILVVLSTYRQPFPRAIRMAAQLAALREEALRVQHGHTQPLADIEAEWRQWYPTRRDLGNAMRRAELVIVHGGSGCIFHALRVGVRPIAIPRLRRYGEHVDDHQLQLCTKLSESRVIVSWNEAEAAAEINERLQNLPRAELAQRPDLRPAVWKAAHELVSPRFR